MDKFIMCHSFHVPQPRPDCLKKGVTRVRRHWVQQRHEKDQADDNGGSHGPMVTSFVACYRPLEQIGGNYE